MKFIVYGHSPEDTAKTIHELDRICAAYPDVEVIRHSATEFYKDIRKLYLETQDMVVIDECSPMPDIFLDSMKPERHKGKGEKARNRRNPYKNWARE